MRATLLISAAVLLASASTQAHHCFAPHDIRQKIELSGGVVSWRFTRPHPVLMLKQDGADGRTRRIEVATRQWERKEIPAGAVAEGDRLDVVIWPARDSSAEGVLSAFINDGAYTLVHGEARQRSAVEAAEAAVPADAK